MLDRRDSFTQDEYKQIIEVLKEKAYKKNNRTEEQFINNNLFKYFCLICIVTTPIHKRRI